MSLEDRARAARAASRVLAAAPASTRNHALAALAARLRSSTDALISANDEDIERATEAGMAPAFVDRLRLTAARIEDMATAVLEIAAQNDPVGRLERQDVRPNGLRVGRMRIPLGVVAVIYEARPNVTSDAAALALRSGNAILLKGGSNARSSNRAVGALITEALADADLPTDAVQVLWDSTRDDIAELLTFDEHIDLVIPRGGEPLIRFVAENSRIPVVKHYKGVCHVYVHASADLDRAEAVVVNAKTGRPSACNAAETLLIDRAIADEAVPRLTAALAKAGVTLHGCEATRALASVPVQAATEADWEAEYLSLDIAVRVVDDYAAAVAHIARYGSDHTEAIITSDLDAANAFTRDVLSSCVMVNASTRFADGGQLGLGAEIGISTSRIHAFGPMGADELTTTRFVVLGEGHVRS